MAPIEIIPFVDFGGDGPPVHFAHANGYPPKTYRCLLEGLATNYHVFAMNMRPLWPGAEPSSISDWRPLAEDLARFLAQQNLSCLYGWGHSMGATTTLRLALRQPEFFQALVLIDPVFFPPTTILFWRLIYRFGLGYRAHPLVKGALKRRDHFDSHAEMYANYRKKKVFARMNDTALRDYVEAQGCQAPDGSITLCYPANWEARIYVTGVRADLELWRQLPYLMIPVLIIRGAETDTFWDHTAHLVKRRLPSAQIHTLPDSTHLVAMEKPEEILAIAKEFVSG